MCRRSWRPKSTSRYWTEHCNELIYRITRLYPENFVGAAQLPQTPGVKPTACIAELDRCINDFGFVGCNLNPDPSGGYWTDLPLTDRWWYPLYEKLVELDVPASSQAGFKINRDYNSEDQEGIGKTQASIKAGRRMSARRGRAEP